MLRRYRADLQRQIDLEYTPATGASLNSIKNWLAHADAELNDGRNRVGSLQAEHVSGAKFLGELDGTLVTKTYKFSGDPDGPDRLISDLSDWGQLAAGPPEFLQFLLDAWIQVRQFAPNERAGAIYDLYGGQAPGRPAVPGDKDADFLPKLKAIFEKKVGWRIWLQGNYFLHVESPDWCALKSEVQEKAQRFYFNPGPDYPSAVKLFNGFLNDFISKYKGKGKIVGPGQYNKRRDCIILWIPNSVAQAAETELSRIKLADLGVTGDGRVVPVMLRGVIQGERSVGTGEEPKGGGGAHSFGSLRAVLLDAALDGATSLYEFLKSASIGFRAAKIPWRSPDQGGEVSVLIKQITLNREI